MQSIPSPVCPTCGVSMRRIGFEHADEQGIVLSFECPSCHARRERILRKTKRLGADLE